MSPRNSLLGILQKWANKIVFFINYVSNTLVISISLRVHVYLCVAEDLFTERKESVHVARIMCYCEILNKKDFYADVLALADFTIKKIRGGCRDCRYMKRRSHYMASSLQERTTRKEKIRMVTDARLAHRHFRNIQRFLCELKNILML